MTVHAITVHGLRSFGTEQSISLATPTGAPGSGLTVLVGPNNSGKSTVVEAFRLLVAQGAASVTEGKRNSRPDGRVRIVVELPQGEMTGLETVDAGGGETKRIGEDIKALDREILVLPSRRYFNPFFDRLLSDRSRYMTHFEVSAVRGSPIDHFSGRLFRVQEKADRRKKFDDIMSRVVDPPPEWVIDLSDTGRYYLKFTSGDSHHSSDGLGDGLVSLLFIVDALYDSEEGNLIVIDEPELSLHPGHQRRLCELFKERSANRQIVLATHSPYFVDFESIAYGAQIVRVVKKKDEQGESSRAYALSDGSRKSIAGLLGDANNPHVLGLDAREVFFLSDGIVLVEGQEDVIDYKKVLQELGLQLNGDFYGWGVGGASKMETVARILSDLGFERVVGIVDRNQADTLASLSESFPHYKFFLLPADNVRTKPKVKCRAAIPGILDERRMVRDEHKEAMTRLIGEVNRALRRPQ